MPSSTSFAKSALAWSLPWDADWVTAVCFLGGRRIAAGNRLGQILVWDLPEKADAAVPPPVFQMEGHSNAVTRLLSSPDGRWLISASFDHSIRYWDLHGQAAKTANVVLNARAIAEATSKKGRRRGKKPPAPVERKVGVCEAARVLDTHREWVQALTQNHDGTLLLSGDDAGQVVLWDRSAAKELRRWQIVKGWCQAAALAPDGKQALISERFPLVFDSGRHMGVRLWDTTNGQPQRDLSAEFKKMYIAAAAYSLDGKILALGRGGEVDGKGGKVFFVDPAKGKKIRELTPAHQLGVTDLVFHPDGEHLASSGRDTLVRIWDVKSGKMVKELGKSRGGQFKDWIHAISFSADGRLLAAADMAGTVQIWSLN